MTSAIGTMSVVITILLFLMILVGFIVLQLFLSKKQNKWLGLILPTVFLLFSIIAVLGVAAYSTVLQGGIGPVMLTGISAFLLFNIPTVIFLIIYFICRKK